MVFLGGAAAKAATPKSMEVSGICRIVFPLPPNLTKIVFFSCIKKKIWRERVGRRMETLRIKKRKSGF